MHACAIRRLEERDLIEFVQLCREHADYEQSVWVERDRLVALRTLLLSSDQTPCWIVEAPGELGGFAAAALERSTWDAGHYLHLDGIYLRPNYRGRGLGRRLMAVVASAATGLRAINLQWQTPIWNSGAARFYERLGAVAKEKLRFTLSAQQCLELGDVDQVDTDRGAGSTA